MDRMSSGSYFGNGMSPTTTMTSNGDHTDISSRLQAQIDSFTQSDHSRNELMHVRDYEYHAQMSSWRNVLTEYQRLLTDNADLHKKVNQLTDDYETERTSRRGLQEDMRKMKAEADRAISKSDNNPFCLVLIDGDGCIFQDKLLKAAASGGTDAAHCLNEEVTQLLRSKGIGSACSVMVQIFMNLDALAWKLRKVGVLNAQEHLKEFAQAFGIAQSLFTIVDVGRGKERADHKIRGKSNARSHLL